MSSSADSLSLKLPKKGDLVSERWRIISPIAKGGMGAVYKAVDTESDDQPVALKFVLPHLLEDDAMRQRFDREVKFAAAFDHPNVVPLLDFGSEGKARYIVMEFLGGSTLHQLTKDGGPMSFVRALGIWREVVAGLAYVHAEGIIHRDLKPSNIMVTDRDDGTLDVRVLDFGISRPLINDATTITTSGSVFGTVGYIAPEVTLYGTASTASCDVYASGVVFLEMLFGRRLYSASTPTQTMFMQVIRGVPLPKELHESPVAELVRKATAMSPELRFQDAAELAEALDAVELDEGFDFLLDAEAAAELIDTHFSSMPDLREVDAVVESFTPIPYADTSPPPRSPISGGKITRALLGTIVDGKFRLERPIGSGGMGTVFLATQLSVDRPVAVKLLPPGQKVSANLQARFEIEAKAVAKLNHPNCLTLHDFGHSKELGAHYMVTEFVDGGSLEDRLHRRLELAEVIEIVAQIADGLQHAHEKGVLHRDLKPTNVMLAVGKDGAPVAKVVDFGVARILADDEVPDADSRITKLGHLCGTPEYMSPEQCLGERDLTPASDVYSLGVVLYELLSGRLPFEAANERLEVLGMHVEDRLPSLRPLELPDGVAAIVERLLAKDPEKRPASAAEVAEALRAIDPSLIPPGPLRWSRSLPVYKRPGRTASTVGQGQAAPVAAQPTGPIAAGKKRRRSVIPALTLTGVALIAIWIYDVNQSASQPFTLHPDAHQLFIVDGARGMKAIGSVDEVPVGSFAATVVDTDRTLGPDEYVVVNLFDYGPNTPEIGARIMQRDELDALLEYTASAHGHGIAVASQVETMIGVVLSERPRADKPFFGLSLSTLQARNARTAGFPGGRGAYVDRVAPGSPAAVGGIRPKDLIVAVNKVLIANTKQFNAEVAKVGLGDAVVFRVLRRSFDSTSERLFIVEPIKRPPDQIPKLLDGAFRGLQLQTLDQRSRRQFAIPEKITGLLVTRTTKEHIPEGVNIARGDVITEVDGADIIRLADLVPIDKRGLADVSVGVWTRDSKGDGGWRRFEFFPNY